MALTPSELRRRKMNLLMAMSYAAFASTKASTWSPSSLFSAGEQGAWYDPSDLTTMFQDSAGTTPVTAVEQPVGLIRDKSGRNNHASQATSASRPVLSARVNLLTYSEQFDNAAWLKYAVAVPVTKYADPYGGTTANLLYPTAATTDAALYRGGFATVGKTHSYAVKAAGKSWFCILKEGTSGGAAWFNLSTGLVGTVAAGYAASNPVSLGNGWYRCTVTSTSGFSQYTAISAVDADNSTTPTPNGTDGIYLWGADLRVTNDGVGIPAYQRVAAATDYDTTGFKYYIRADGTDDRLVTSAIDFSATDAVSVLAGVRKLSDAARSTIVELTATADANNGAFHLTAPNAASATYAFESKGTALTDAVVSTGVAAPITNVLTGLADISADSNVLRVNGVQADSDAGDQGTGNFSNAVLYIGSRGGSTLPFNGRIYGLAVVGRALTSTEISNMESWLAAKTGVSL